jgi:16S rRNA (adenine1518-N6/adenine1519-N6)-dimethyltransferase
VIRAAFGERRKTLVNALSTGLARPRATLDAAVREAGLDPRVRGERLTLEDFRRLADLLDTGSAPRSGSHPSR